MELIGPFDWNDLVAMLYAIYKPFRFFWVTGLFYLILYLWHSDLVRITDIFKENQPDDFDLNEWNKKTKKVKIALNVALCFFLASWLRMAWLGLH